MTDTRSARRGSRPWLKWALIASLAVNLAVAGLMFGAALRLRSIDVAGPRPGPALISYARALPDPYRAALRRDLRESRDEWIGAMSALRAQRAALADAVEREPFDRAAVAAALSEETRLAGILAARGSALLVDQIARMDREHRAAYAEELRKPPRRIRHRDGDARR